MIISNIAYSQNIGINGEWHLKDVSLNKLNLIVSRNAVGKTRTVNILNALVNLLTGKIPILPNGNWDITFVNGDKQLRYILRTQDREVIKEQIRENGRVLLDRKGESGFIVCLGKKGEPRDKYSPPRDKLTNQVRRDVEQHPFLEDLVRWAEKYYSFTFSLIRPNQYSLPIPRQPDISGHQGAALFSPDLSLAPYMFKEISNDVSIKRSIIKDLKQVGYDIRDLDTVEFSAAAGVSSINILERSINFPITQQELSQGMFRVIAIIITMHYLRAKAIEGTIIIDDLCEGLDFSRSLKLATLLFEKAENENTQIIATTNDQFLMNSVDMKHWNILERRGKYVRSFNYKNSKETFDEYKLIGINNFDFFATGLYKGLRRND